MADKIPLIIASNMAIGVNVLFALVETGGSGASAPRV
jgi:dihydrodipicolinate reductase